MKSLLLAIVLLVLCLPLLAQEPTQEAAPQATVDAPVVINIEAPAAPVETSPADGSLWGYVLVIGSIIIGGFVAVSFVLQGIGNRAQAAANNPLEIAVIEKAYDSIPSAVVTTIIDPLKASLERSDEALRQVLIFLGKATDKIPESEKLPQPPLIVGVNTYPQSSGSVTSNLSYDPSANVEPPQTP